MDVPLRGQSHQAKGVSIKVHGMLTERAMVILQEAKPHLVEYMAMLMEDLDDQRLYRDIDKY